MSVNSTQEMIVKTITVNYLHLNIPISKHLLSYTDLDCKKSSVEWNKLFNKAYFTSFIKWLKLSNFLIFKSNYLYNVTPMFNTLTQNKVVLQNCACKSYLLLMLCSCITKFCFEFTLYFFMKHKTLKTYSEVTVKILFSLNFCLQNSFSLYLLLI
jgi:hypothetical protein